MESWAAAASAVEGGEASPSPAVNGGAGNQPEGAAGDPDATLEWRAPFVLDLPRTLGVHARGRGDPAYRVTADGFIWRTSLTPEGPGTLRVAPVRPSPPGVAGGAGLPGVAGGAVPGVAGGALAAPGLPRPGGAWGCPAGPCLGLPAGRCLGLPGGPVPGVAGREVPGPVTVVRAAAWGPGAAWLLRELPGMLGADDDRAAFRPAHPVLAELSARHPGVRVGRSARVLEALVPAVLEQKVVGVEARRAWRYLLLKFGDPAPGPAPAGMRVCPPARVWRRIPSWEWHRAGVEGVRARTIIGAAEVAARLEEIVAMPAGCGGPPAAVAGRDRRLDLG